MSKIARLTLIVLAVALVLIGTAQLILAYPGFLFEEEFNHRSFLFYQTVK